MPNFPPNTVFVKGSTPTILIEIYRSASLIFQGLISKKSDGDDDYELATYAVNLAIDLLVKVQDRSV